MKNELALKYLLLRHIKTFESILPSSLFKEVVEDLKVIVDTDSYNVYWRLGGEVKTKQILRKDFVFFCRGDLSNDTNIDKDLSSNNDILAQNIAKEILNISHSQNKGNFVSNISLPPDILTYLLFILIFLLSGINYLACLALTAILLSEYRDNGKTLASLLFIVFSFFSYGAAMFGALAYSIFQFFDPDPDQRKTRITLSLIAFVTSLFIVIIKKPDLNIAYPLILVFYAFCISGFKSLFGLSYRLMPLVLPFVCVGFALENKIIPALIGMCFYSFLVLKSACLSMFRAKTKGVFS